MRPHIMGKIMLSVKKSKSISRIIVRLNFFLHLKCYVCIYDTILLWQYFEFKL